MKKAIITVVGKDTVGILAKTCTYLAKNNVNILDIFAIPVKQMSREIHSCRVLFKHKLFL